MIHTLKRIILFTAGLGLGLVLLTGTASAAPSEHASDKAAEASAKGASKGASATSDAANDAVVEDPAEAAAPDQSSKEHDCNGTHHSDTGHGANDADTPHAYSETCDEDVASGNGQPGEGDANGRPCAGCVGNADDKNPPGQAPDAQHDGNNGYECDRKGDVDGGNNGIAFGNPAHSGCEASEEQPPSEEENPPVTPETPPVVKSTPEVCVDGVMTVDHDGDGKVNGADCAPAVLSATVSPAAEAAVLGVAVELPAQVLGTSFELDSAAPATLARTGALVEPAGLLMSALTLIAFGTMLLASRRRSGLRSTC